ncbi:MAG: arsenic resistance protein [Peptococcaceae bacterium]|nr:arsenic resistance protein [Peptococcaceae bacterium]
MNTFIKCQPLFIILSALMGLGLGYYTSIGHLAVTLIEPFLMMLLFFVFLSIDNRKLAAAFKNKKFAITATAINFLWTPIFAYALGLVFFHQSLALQMGLLMLMVTPCTDWYIVFTSISGGNVALGASILPFNLLLQILLLPVYLIIFFGNSVHFDILSILFSMIVVLIIPFALSFGTKAAAKKSSAINRCVNVLKSWGDHEQLLFLCLAIICMFASESKQVFGHPLLFLQMLLPLIIFFAINLLLVRFIGKKERLPSADITALNFTTLARNSPLSLAIAVAAFPDMPLISLALVIGPLIELPALGIISSILKKAASSQA